MNKKALIAMSGGVDSSVAAFLMIKRGYSCMGVTMKLFENNDAAEISEKTCCSLNDVEDARSIAYRLKIPYYVFNFTEEFKSKVIYKFVDVYEKGGTPNPCIDCNKTMKFEKLYQRALMLECDFVVTGHYARIEKKNGRLLLKKAVDSSKDQSYVLYFLTQDQLAHICFPLGCMHKTQVRDIAQENHFVNADKHESQDICFVPSGNYARVIEYYSHKKYPYGNFVDSKGNILGEHKGIVRYTIGQRKGLGLALKQPLYVCGKNTDKNLVILGRNEELYSKELDACSFNWIAYDIPPDIIRAKAKIRYRHTEQWATVTTTAIDTVHIIFDEPQRAITSGQAVVLYDGDVVIGGGTIC